MGVNRVSLGLQSTVDKELKLLGRIHTYEEFLESYHLLRGVDFDNINIDLMRDILSRVSRVTEKLLSVLWH